MTNQVLFSREDAINHLPELIGWSNRLMATIVEPVIRQADLRVTNRPFRLMCLMFLCRQFNHAQSLVALQNNIDIVLIARTMLEGTILLLWVRLDMETRSLFWRNYSFIHDWRLLKKHRDAGITVSDREWDKAQQLCVVFGEPFLTRQARTAISRKSPLPDDPYQKFWHPQDQFKWRTACVDIGHEDWYDNLYVGLCRYYHWECPNTALTVSRVGDDFIYSPYREDDEYFAILIGILSVHTTLQIANLEMDLGLSQQVITYRDEFQRWLQSIHSDFQLPFISPMA